jgi:hypothetical protein
MHPIALGAAGVLAVNDWVLKPRFASWWTGKLSDVAGLVCAPLLLSAVIGLGVWIATGAGRLTRARLYACVAATGAVFAAVKLSPEAAHLLARALRAVIGRAAIVADPTDLFALPALAVPLWLGARQLARPR